MTEQAPRPGQTTFAGWLIIGGSVVLVVAAWQRIAGLHTLEVQDELRKLLSEPPIDGSGLTVNMLSDVIRVLAMIAAGAATASAILGFHALRRSTSARLALTCLAPLVLVGGLATAGFLAPMVAAGVAMLWVQPTRDWFRGTSAAPVATKPVPQPQPGPPVAPPPLAPPQQPFAYAAPPVAVRPARPPAIVAACIVTWVCTALVAGGMLLAEVAIMLMPDDTFDEMVKQAEQSGPYVADLSRSEIVAATLVLAVVVVVWCIAGAVLAVLAFRRVMWAWIALIVSAAAAGLLLLVTSLAAPYLVVLVAAAAVTCSLLLRADARAWIRR
ncbi:hypothetical protein [Nocardioides panacisoli]